MPLDWSKITNLLEQTNFLQTTHFHFHPQTTSQKVFKTTTPPGLYPSYYCSMLPSPWCLYSSNPPGPSMPGKTSPTALQNVDCQDGVNRSTCHPPAPCQRGQRDGPTGDLSSNRNPPSKDNWAGEPPSWVRRRRRRCCNMLHATCSEEKMQLQKRFWKVFTVNLQLTDR